ncbi:unnamed protein product [Amoebophrya sp. A120]|nr:unnamed protein product [Amoebophrya sp. A120]|eukprot:GSA120T00016857001.1
MAARGGSAGPNGTTTSNGNNHQQDVFKDLTLRQAERVLSKLTSYPSDAVAFFELLKITTPELEEDPFFSFNGKLVRDQSWKAFLLRMHPDKHQGDSNVSLSTEVFQKAKNLYASLNEKNINWGRERKPSAYHAGGTASANGGSFFPQGRTGAATGATSSSSFDRAPTVDPSGRTGNQGSSSASTSTGATRTGAQEERSAGATDYSSSYANKTREEKREQFPSAFNIYENWPWLQKNDGELTALEKMGRKGDLVSANYDQKASEFASSSTSWTTTPNKDKNATTGNNGKQDTRTSSSKQTTNGGTNPSCSPGDTNFGTFSFGGGFSTSTNGTTGGSRSTGASASTFGSGAGPPPPVFGGGGFPQNFEAPPNSQHPAPPVFGNANFPQPGNANNTGKGIFGDGEGVFGNASNFGGGGPSVFGGNGTSATNGSGGGNIFGNNSTATGSSASASNLFGKKPGRATTGNNGQQGTPDKKNPFGGTTNQNFGSASFNPSTGQQEDQPPSSTDVHWHLTLQLINLRGAITHGRPIGLPFTKASSLKDRNLPKQFNVLDMWTGDSVEDLLRPFGGARRLHGRSEIKKEIMTNGPVVSTSFYLDGQFAERTKHPFDAGRIGGLHELLLVGWEVNEFGECWLVKALHKDTAFHPSRMQDVSPDGSTSPRGRSSSTGKSTSRKKQDASNSKNNSFRIGFGQFQIEDEVLTFSNEKVLESVTWQPGPYLEIENQDDVKWQLGEKQLSVPLSADMLEKVLIKLGGGSLKGLFQMASTASSEDPKVAAATSRSAVYLEILPNSRKAGSRRIRITDLELPVNSLFPGAKNKAKPYLLTGELVD